MKLILCKQCSDIFRLWVEEPRHCKCGSSGGVYIDDLNARIYGKAIPLGFANWSFVAAVREQPESGWGKNFDAFVIPKSVETIEHVPSASELE